MTQEERMMADLPTEELKERTYVATWKYGDKSRHDYIVLKKRNETEINLHRWTTFKSFHFPHGAIITGFRGRRDYKDGNCEGIMCCKWCCEKREFIFYMFTISNGYNGMFSEKDFESMEIVDQTEFTNLNPDAVKNIKSQLK